MRIEDAIQQKKFNSEKEKALLNILYTGSWINTLQQRFFKTFDLSPQQYNVLRILRGQHPNPVSVSSIQDRMIDKMSNVSRLVEKLRQGNLIKRSECSKDRRQMDIIITDEGLALLMSIDNQHEDLNNLMESIDHHDAKLLNELLDKLRTKQ